MATLPRYFFSSLLAHLYCLPRYLILWCKWLAKGFPRSAHSSSSSDDGPLHLSSPDSHPRVQLGLVCKWVFYHPRIGHMGLYALFCVRILLFHTYKMIKFIIILSHIVTICIFKNLESILETKSNYGVYYMIIFKLYYL